MATLVRVLPWRVIAAGWVLTMAVTALIVIFDPPSLIAAIGLGATVAVVLTSVVVPAALDRTLAAIAEDSTESRTPAARQPAAGGEATVPGWALKLLNDRDAERYSKEWSAHLSELVERGEGRQARRDRRRLVLAAVLIGIAIRLRGAPTPR